MKRCGNPECEVEFDGPANKIYCGRACQLVAYRNNQGLPLGQRSGRASRWTVNIPGRVHDRLHEAALARDVPMTWLAGRLLDEALDMLPPPEEFSLTRRRGDGRVKVMTP